MFARALDGDSARLVEAIDKFVAENEDSKARGFVVFAAPQDELESKVKDFAEAKRIGLPLSFFADGPEGNGAETYKLNAEVPLTILLVKDKKVTLNLTPEEIDEETLEEIEEEFEGIL